METRIKELNTHLRGWINYFGIAQGYQQNIDLDHWIRRRLPYISLICFSLCISLLSVDTGLTGWLEIPTWLEWPLLMWIFASAAVVRPLCDTTIIRGGLYQQQIYLVHPVYHNVSLFLSMRDP